MGDKTGITWTDATWSPLTGCKAVSPGCDHCYSERQTAGRLSHLPAYAGLTEGGRWTGAVRTLPERLDQPLKWKRPRRIFVNSMSDLWHPDVSIEFIAQVFAVMALADQHQFQVLTKRPQRMSEMVGSPVFAELVSQAVFHRDRLAEHVWPLPNVWLGTSIESQAYAFRARHLLDTPAAVRFVSAEPLLGPLDLGPWLPDWDPDIEDRVCQAHGLPDCQQETGCMGIDWVIVGGESGPGSRHMSTSWARDLRDQCAKAGTAFFMKQAGRELGREWGCRDGHGADQAHWPADLRVQEFPA